MDAISIEEGIKRVVNNEALYHRLLKTFSGRKLVDQIIEAVNNGDLEVAATSCHALRGTAANLAMKPLAETVGKIEELIKESKNPLDMLDTLKENLEAVEEAIQKITSE